MEGRRLRRRCAQLAIGQNFVPDLGISAYFGQHEWARADADDRERRIEIRAVPTVRLPSLSASTL